MPASSSPNRVPLPQAEGSSRAATRPPFGRKASPRTKDTALRREALEILTAIMRGDLGALLETRRGKTRLRAEALATYGKIVKAATFDSNGNLIGLELADKLEAIDRLAQLLGWYPAEKHEHRHVEQFGAGKD